MVMAVLSHCRITAGTVSIARLPIGRPFVAQQRYHQRLLMDRSSTTFAAKRRGDLGDSTGPPKVPADTDAAPAASEVTGPTVPPSSQAPSTGMDAAGPTGTIDVTVVDPRFGQPTMGVGLQNATDDANELTQTAISDASVNAQAALDSSSKQVGQAARAAATNVDAAVDQVKSGVDQAADVASDLARQGSSAVAGTVQDAADASARTIRATERAADRVANPPPRVTEYKPLTSMPAYREEGPDQVDYLKRRLLASVAGLDRGYAASQAQAAGVDAAVTSLVDAAGGSSAVSWMGNGTSDGSSLAKLNGTWRLVYYSGLRPVSMGGRNRDLLPFALGQVLQVIDARLSYKLDNVIELYSKLNFPSLPGGPTVEPTKLTAILRNSFRTVDRSTVELSFLGTDLKPSGGISGVLNNLPEFKLPDLPLFQTRRRAISFDVLFVDDEMRVTRRGGKLGVWVKT